MFTQFAGVPNSVFADIWDQCNDESHPGKLTEKEFVAAMHLIALYTQGFKLDLKAATPPRQLMDSIPDGSAARPQAARPAPSLPPRQEDPMSAQELEQRAKDEAQRGADRLKVFEEQRRKAALAAGLAVHDKPTIPPKPPSPKPPSPQPPSPQSKPVVVPKLIAPSAAQIADQERKKKAEEDRAKLDLQRKQDEAERLEREKLERERWEKEESERKAEKVKLEEQKRIDSEKARLDEQKRIDAEKARLDEQKRIDVEKARLDEQKRIDAEKAMAAKANVQPAIPPAPGPVTQPAIQPVVSLTVDAAKEEKAYKAHVIFSYDPDPTSSTDGLTLQEDDQVMVESEDAEWAYGYVVGKPEKKGWMPRTYIEASDGVIPVPDVPEVKTSQNLVAVPANAPIVRVVTPQPPSPPPVDSLVVIRPTLYVGKALYDYEASGEGDGSLKEGRDYPVIEENDDWSLIRDGDKEGWVPRNYIEKTVASKKVYLCNAKILASFTAADEAELTVKEGDVVGVVEKLPDGWWQAEFNGKEGLIPESYCQEMQGSNSTTGGAAVDPAKMAKIEDLKQRLAKEQNTKAGIEKMLTVPSIPKDQVLLQLKEVDAKILQISSELNPLLYG